jgi:capsular exopolysaccharide synthesis family protein
MFSRLSRPDRTANYLRPILRWWWIPVLFAMLSGVAVYAGSRHFMKPVYGAKVTLQVSTSLPGSGSGGSTDAISDATLITTAPVLRHAASMTARGGEKRAIEAASCVAGGNDVFIVCKTQSPNYKAAYRGLNLLAQTFIAVNQKTQQEAYGPTLSSLSTQIKQLEKEINILHGDLGPLLRNNKPTGQQEYQITALQSQIAQEQSSLSPLLVQEATVRQQMVARESNIHVVNPAVPNRSPISPHPARDALLGVILGLAFGGALIILFEYLDDRFQTPEELAMVLDVNVLGAVRRFTDLPAGNSLLPHAAPRSAAAEAYRVVRTNLEFANVAHPAKLIVVTSSSENEGKTTTSSNLAAAIAIAGKHVLLIDGDLRRGGLTSALRLRGQPGLSSVLLGAADDQVIRRTPVPNLEIVPSGPFPPNPAELLGSSAMRGWMSRMVTKYDIVIVDAPPVLNLSDARILAPAMDGVLLVIDPESSTRRLAQQAKLGLDAVGALVLGIVINRGAFRADPSYSYYGSYYYGTGDYSYKSKVGDTPRKGQGSSQQDTDIPAGPETVHP